MNYFMWMPKKRRRIFILLNKELFYFYSGCPWMSVQNHIRKLYLICIIQISYTVRTIRTSVYYMKKEGNN